MGLIRDQLDYESESLVIVFSSGPNSFDWTNTLENTLKEFSFQKLYIADDHKSWWQFSFEVLEGRTGPEPLVNFLKKKIIESKCKKVMTIGSSMGGYGALTFGCLLNVDRVISVVPQIDISNLPEEYGLIKSKFKEKGINLNNLSFKDLLSKNLSNKTEYHVYYGINNEHDVWQFSLIKDYKNVKGYQVKCEGVHHIVPRVIVKDGTVQKNIIDFIRKGEGMKIKTERTTLEFYSDYVLKTYNLNDEVNRMSSVENEFKSFEKFSMGEKNPYCPEVGLLGKDKYKIKKYSFGLGGRKRIEEANIRRMLFTISYEEFDRQLAHIEHLLKEIGMVHRDINPGNLLFSEDERKLKLIDFYWAKSEGINPGNPPNLNDRYSTDDSISFRMIKDEVKFIDEQVRKMVDTTLRFHLNEMGRVYLDGSAGAPGRAYHTIDIPYLKDVPKSNDGREEFNTILKHMTVKPKKILDIGCAVGFNTFNMMRKFDLDLAVGFEADPHVYSFLQGCKTLFNLSEFFVEPGITPDFYVPHVDVVLCMNVHMWLHKQFGKEGCDKIMNELLKYCKELFFQTAGSESHGMYLIKELNSKEAIEQYLKSLNSKEVHFIRTTNAHGGFRHFFRVKGQA